MDRDNKFSPSALDGLMNKKMNRRTALQSVGAGAAFCAIGNGPGYDGLNSIAGGVEAGSGNLRINAVTNIPAYQVDLPIPPVLAPYSTDANADYYNIDITSGEIDILTGLVNGAGPTEVFGYAPAGGQPTVPGPTIKARAHRRVVVTANNKLPGNQDTVVHLHGGVTEAASDGHPMDIITPNNSRVYRYDSKQDAATLWYHEHGHGHTAAGVYAGLAAFFLLTDDKEESLNLPSGEYDIPLFVTDRAFRDDGNFQYAPSLLSAYWGQGWTGIANQMPTVNLVNGAPLPRMQVQRRKYRFRVLSGANTRAYQFILAINGDTGSRKDFIQIGTDAGLLEKPLTKNEIFLAPAERGDIVVDFSDLSPGASVELLDIAPNTFGAPQIQELDGVAKVMRFEVVSGGGSEDFEVRNRLAEPKVLPAPSTQRTFLLDQGPSDPGHPYAVRNEWQINGRGYDDHRVDVRPRRGTTEIWHFVNKSNFYHPMHMHLGHFKVVSRGGRPVNEPGWKDTVFVAGRETVSVLAYFGGFTGRYVYHCHALEHGDLNMMGQMEVTN